MACSVRYTPTRCPSVSGEGVRVISCRGPDSPSPLSRGRHSFFPVVRGEGRIRRQRAIGEWEGAKRRVWRLPPAKPFSDLLVPAPLTGRLSGITFYNRGLE